MSPPKKELPVSKSITLPPGTTCTSADLHQVLLKDSRGHLNFKHLCFVLQQSLSLRQDSSPTPALWPLTAARPPMPPQPPPLPSCLTARRRAKFSPARQVESTTDIIYHVSPSLTRTTDPDHWPSSVQHTHTESRDDQRLKMGKNFKYMSSNNYKIAFIHTQKIMWLVALLPPTGEYCQLVTAHRHF